MANQKQKPHRNWLDDSLERIAETGKSAAKQTVQSLNYAVNPFASSPFEQKLTGEQTKQQVEMQQQMQEKMKNEGNSTPLDFNKLDTAYKNQDQDELALQRRYFQRIKNMEEQVWEEQKQRKAEEERREAEEEAEKRKQEQEAQIETTNEVAGKQKSKGPNASRPKAQVNPFENNPRANKH